jgi:hypothetical protein
MYAEMYDKMCSTAFSRERRTEYNICKPVYIQQCDTTNVGMVEDTPSHAQRAKTSGGDIASLGFVEERSREAALGCFRELKENPNRQLAEPTFYTVEEPWPHCQGQRGQAG